MIHAYLTDGMYGLAEVFLKSLWKTNEDTFRVLLSTRELKDKQVKKLREFHPCVDVENKRFNYEEMADRAKVSVPKLLEYKRQIEKRYVTPENRVWKLMIAAEDRPRSLFDLLQRGEGSGTPIFHFDIDTLFLKSIMPIMNTALAHDCCLLFRPKINPIKARITISTMFWRRTEVVLEFFQRWMHWLDACPPPERPIGYGQTSCWYAYKDVEDRIKVHTLGPAWGYPGKKMNRGSNFVWSGAVHKLTKADCIKQFGEKLGEFD